MKNYLIVGRCGCRQEFPVGADERRFRVQLEVGLLGESVPDELLKPEISEAG